MAEVPAERSLVFLGGDRRTLVAAELLQNMGIPVKVHGLTDVPPDVEVVDDLLDALPGARALILPVPGPDAGGGVTVADGTRVVVNRSLLEQLPVDAFLITGWSRSVLTQWAREADRVVHEIMDRDDFALYNAVPTSEGAILEAMKRSDITIAGSECHVVGYGRCARVQAQHLRGLNAIVTIIARRSAARADAEVQGYQVCNLEAWRDRLPSADFIFNTVPAHVLDRSLLALTKPSVVIVDVASSPGGVDFEAARELHRDAVILPGLPSKRAPRSAGAALARVIADLVAGQ